MKKQYNTIVLALSLLLLSINILNAQETSPFTYEITQPVCSPYGSISLTNSGAAIGQEFELEYYNAIEENSLTRNSTLIDKSYIKITSIAKGVNGNTLAHEIGHAKYGLQHPDNDTTHLKIINIDPPANYIRKYYNFSDRDNFMFSTQSGGRSSNIRAYQWRKIIFGRY